MAAFVVHIGISPSEYLALTLMERDAIAAAHRKRKR